MSRGTNIRMWRRSLFVLASLIFLGFGVCFFRLFYLQIIKGKNLQEMASAQQLKDTVISAQRGTIYDCNMKPLAQSATVWTVVLEPLYLKKEEQKRLVAEGLSTILDLPKEEILEKSRKKSYYVVIKRKVEADIKDRILDFKKKNRISSGIRLIEDTKRYYPFGEFASSLLGFVGIDGTGLDGLEAYLNPFLAGKNGRIKTAKNAIGTDMPFDFEKMVDAENGCNVVLTIDETIQHFLEKHLEEGIKDHKVINRAVAIMMDVNDGRILGLAVKGGFDPNEPQKIASAADRAILEKTPEEERKKIEAQLREKQWRNKAICDTYYPGSVWKIFTTAMALSENLITDSTTFNCTGSMVPFKGAKSIRCHNRSGHGQQVLKKAFSNSCNSAFMQIGLSVGTEKFYRYYKKFGFAEKTGIDLPGEALGIFFSKDGSMSLMDLSVASFGQNFAVTPIQMITAVSASVNGGYLLKPYVVQKILDKNGNIVKSNSRFVRRQVISNEISKKIRELLELTAKEGGAKSAYIPGYKIGGKTGTTEKIGLSRAGQLDHIASCVVAAPCDDPKVALLVLYDTPTGPHHFASQVAAPTAGKIMADVLPYLGVKQRFTNEEVANLHVSAPFLVGSSVAEAVNKLKKLNLVPIVYGNGKYVISQNPAMGTVVTKGGTVVLHTDEKSQKILLKVPDFIGKNLSLVNKEASNLKLNLVVKGIGSGSVGSNFVAISQNIPPGTTVSQSSVVEVTFKKKETASESD